MKKPKNKPKKVKPKWEKWPRWHVVSMVPDTCFPCSPDEMLLWVRCVKAK